MIISVVACGNSAKEWFKTPCDLSVGVNDCVKFGHQVDNLVVVNAPNKFNPKISNGHTDRLKTIIESKPKRFLCHNSNWKPYFPNYEILPLRSFIGTYRKDRIYSSKTSPMVAITLAASLGATHIVIWGVDFLDHARFSAISGPKHQPDFITELGYYGMLFEALERNGAKCWIGNENTVLKKYLPVWNPTAKMV